MSSMYLVYVPVYETETHEDDDSFHRHNVGITIYGVYQTLDAAKKRCVQVYQQGLRGPNYPISKLGDDFDRRHVRVPRLRTGVWGLEYSTGLQWWEVYVMKVPADSDEWDWDNPPGENITLAGQYNGPQPNPQLAEKIDQDILKRLRLERILDLEE